MATAEPRRPFSKPTKVKQACDQCHSRKVRCDGTLPCTNCLIASADCTYIAVHKKTGPKGPRRRKAQQDSYPKPCQRTTVNAQSSVASNDDRSETVRTGSVYTPTEDGSTTGFQTSPRVSLDIISKCLDAFFTYKYPVTPILDSDEISAILPSLATSPEHYGLLTACCAVMVLSPEIVTPTGSPASSKDTESHSSFSDDVDQPKSSPELPDSEFLVSETLRARRYCDWTVNPSLTTIQTSFFLFSAYFCLGKDNPAWFYLREAITLTQLLRYHEEETYESLDPHSHLAVFARRMFWVLFITERAYALQRHRLLTLHQTIALPSVDSGLEEPILSGFLELIFLFNNFDDDFMNLWNVQSREPDASSASLARLQDRLRFGLYDGSSFTRSQEADLVVSRQWLKTMIWQLCVSKALLSSHADEESMSIAYPVTISRDVIHLSALLPSEAFEANGIGIVEKLFDIGCSLADVLTLQPRLGTPVALEYGARDYLMEIVRMVSTVVGGSSKHLSVLALKANECLDTSINRIGWDMAHDGEDFCRVSELQEDEEFETIGDGEINEVVNAYEQTQISDFDINATFEPLVQHTT